MTKEHIGIAQAIGLPMIVVFTKIDLASKEIFKENIDKMKKILKTACSKIPVMIKTEKEIAKLAPNAF